MKFPNPLFPLGSLVYLRVNAERRGMVTGYTVRPGGILLYLVSWDEPIQEMEHWGCELSDQKVFGEETAQGESTPK